jgi:CBS domain containing-hemolysin-like protein
LTPKLLDELFSSGYKIFPVINNSIDHTVGFLYLDDVLPIDQHEKVLADVIRKAPPPVDQTAPLEAALKQMAEYHSSVLLVEKDGKVVGLVTMTDIVRSLFGSHDL